VLLLPFGQRIESRSTTLVSLDKLRVEFILRRNRGGGEKILLVGMSKTDHVFVQIVFFVPAVTFALLFKKTILKPSAILRIRAVGRLVLESFCLGAFRTPRSSCVEPPLVLPRLESFSDTASRLFKPPCRQAKILIALASHRSDERTPVLLRDAPGENFDKPIESPCPFV